MFLHSKAQKVYWDFLEDLIQYQLLSWALHYFVCSEEPEKETIIEKKFERYTFTF